MPRSTLGLIKEVRMSNIERNRLLIEANVLLDEIELTISNMFSAVIELRK